MTHPEFPSPTPVPATAEIPEHMVVLLLEGAQRFLAQAQDAIRRKDSLIRDHYLKKVLVILRELNSRLNPEQGGDLVMNLTKVYDFWGHEILAGGEQDDADRLKVIFDQMGEIRQAWEQLLFRGEGLTENPEF
jgi:flagellar protein FliS